MRECVRALCVQPACLCASYVCMPSHGYSPMSSIAAVHDARKGKTDRQTDGPIERLLSTDSFMRMMNDMNEWLQA